jgi:multiple sugar transport system permease protein
MLLGLGIALLLNIDLPGMRVFRTALIVPMMMTPIVGALCWKLLLDPSHGVLNQWIGEKIVWLGRPDTAIYAIWLVGVWQNTTYVTLILLAGLRSLASEPLGGGYRWREQFSSAPVRHASHAAALSARRTSVAHDLRFRAFDNIYAMTGGGRANSP